MIALYIIVGLMALIVLILLLPFSVHIAFKDSLSLSVYFVGIKVYSLKESNEPETTAKPPLIAQKTSDNMKDSTFVKLKVKYGFTGAVKIIISFAKRVLIHLNRLLHFIKFRKVFLDIVVADDDAAKNAIEYGAISALVYPTLSFISTKTNLKFKEINLRADYNALNGKFDFYTVISAQMVFLLFCAFKILKEYKIFIARIEDDE